MSARKLVGLSSFIILPALYLLFWRIEVFAHGRGAETLKWDALLLLVTIIALEQLYGYRFAVPQKFVLTRDLIANVVNKYITGAVAALIVLPVLHYAPEHFLGRKTLLASPAELGPFWLQVILIVISVSFFRY